MKRIFFVFSILFSSFANASSAFASEFSHFSGGFIIAALVAYLIVRYSKKHRDKAIFWAFWSSTIFVFISQTRDYISSGKFWGQALDFFWHTVGTLLAVYLADKLITLKIKKDIAKRKANNNQN